MNDEISFSSRAATLMDDAYAELMTAADRLAEAFGLEARAIQRKNDTAHVPIFLTVSQTSPNAKSITWQKMQFTRAKGSKKGVCKPLGIAKGGRGSAYPSTAFDFVKDKELRALVRQYEKQAAIIRAVASENRALRRKLLSELAKAGKLLEDMNHN